MQQLKREDFPLQATEAVKEAFEEKDSHRRTTKLLMDALVSSISDMDTANPWDITRKEMPNIAEASDKFTIKYNAMTGNFTASKM